MLGVDGLGKRSLARLASFVVGHDFFELDTSAQSPSVDDFRGMLRMAFKSAIFTSRHVVILAPIPHECPDAIMEDINSLLGSGMLPFLFNADQTSEFIREMKLLPQFAEYQDEMEHADSFDAFPYPVYRSMVKSVQKNIHLIVSFSSAGIVYYERIRKYPALATCMSVDWFDLWLPQALKSVALTTLVPLASEGEATVVSQVLDVTQAAANSPLSMEQISAVSDLVVDIHQSVQSAAVVLQRKLGLHAYITPAELLDLLHTFSLLLR